MTDIDTQHCEDISELFERMRRIRETVSYSDRDCPGETFEKALEIRDVWLGDELDEAQRRGDETAIRNIGQAAFVRLSEATEGHERIRRRAAFNQANRLLLEFALQQG